jgi:hypothetical protein
MQWIEGAFSIPEGWNIRNTPHYLSQDYFIKTVTWTALAHPSGEPMEYIVNTTRIILQHVNNICLLAKGCHCVQVYAIPYRHLTHINDKGFEGNNNILYCITIKRVISGCYLRPVSCSLESLRSYTGRSSSRAASRIAIGSLPPPVIESGGAPANMLQVW